MRSWLYCLRSFIFNHIQPSHQRDIRMSVAELVSLLAFVSSIVAVYTAAAVLGIRHYRRRRTPHSAFSSPGEVWLYRIVYVLAAVGILCMAYARFVEPNWPRFTYVKIQNVKGPAGSRAIRLVQISDLHSESTPRLEQQVVDLIASQKPDLIAFTGDAINSSQCLSVFKTCLRNLAALAPTFAVRGNWDTQRWRHLDLFGDTNVRELNGEGVTLSVNGTTLWVGGAPNQPEGGLDRVLRQIPPNIFSIVLFHSPSEIYDVAEAKADLCLTGDTHGGQIALPFYGALMTLSKFGKKFEGGLYRVDSTWLYVNRGIGMDGRFPAVRFGVRPEITVIDILPTRRDRPAE